ncbi:TPA: hypothetical protein ACG5DL_001574 [Klebsiella pneumoniae]|uniref:hypothetical protein n=3 Tax=Enterobacteriaceae TaxID=543 RepID=UPI00115A382B|nr:MULTISPECIES: hypothetical protein [Klebsiella]MCF8599505.1 hypothetical protein [Klebsiella sp. 2019SCSN059]HBM3146268.1 hypothetical protein [Klebsiella oxytoca]HBQ5813705.1 hypothetical protein [Klebsiella pneumoniae subsp. pneumoniae]HDH1371746.1 hypothetical protein [Klebsiella quasipneumoniae subsp. similipneumoniae]MBD7871513.1 hypothetical protein [Klebsiella pneumoniae]
MMRKGLTGDEILSMSMKEFYMVYLFDTFIEPQGPVMNDFYQARLAHSVIASNPNLTAEGRKKINMKDFYLLKDKVFKSPEELQKEKQKEQERKRKALESMFEPELLAKARKSIK